MSAARVSGATFSQAEERALEALADLDRRNRHAGADLRLEAYRITEGLCRLRDWLAASDRLADEMPGSKRLRKRRRRGILREIEGSERGRPNFDPPMHATTFAPEPRAHFLKDELETIVIAGRREDGHWRPAKDEVTFDEARGLAAMKAGTLYRLTSKELVPGLIRRMLGEDGSSHTTELRFDSTVFIRWGVVLRVLIKRRH